MLALKIANLQFAYPETPVLRGISLEIPEGQHVGLIGPNGVGKTTLFHAICGILKPTGGSVHLFEQPIKAGRFNPDVGLLFQYPDDQLFSPSVREDIAFGPLNMGLSPEDVKQRVQSAIDATAIEYIADRTPHQLSGGQKRMVAIAGVQAMQPRVMLYDEPSANLDIRSRRRLMAFIKNSAETVLVSSHDLELILELSQRVILLDEGRIIADGDPLEIMGNAALMEAHGLEKPHSLRPHRHTTGNPDRHAH
ncbi:MAG: energy-coupling factor ABC transporter ATP-binding protein [Candidatus Promineifilaceae bacterium]